MIINVVLFSLYVLIGIFFAFLIYVIMRSAKSWTETISENLTVVSKYEKKFDGDTTYLWCFTYNGKNIKVSMKENCYNDREVGDIAKVTLKLKYYRGLLYSIRVESID